MNGLSEDNAQGWLAAIGVLYILDRMGLDVQMQWQNFRPKIIGANKKTVTRSLVEYHSNGSDILERLPVGPAGEKTPLDLTAGRVKLTAVIKEMLATVTIDKISEALDHPWINRDDITSLGWDTGAVKLAASIGGERAPDSSPHRGVLAGQWLAAESLPITSSGARLSTYSWVSWSVPLDLGGVRAVILSKSEEWGGVSYESNIGRNGQMGYLEPARMSVKH